jgi:MFS family permease
MNFKRSDTIVPISIGLTQGLSSAFFIIIATRLGASPFLIGIISSSPYFGNLLAPFWSYITQKMKIPKTLAITIFLDSAILSILSFIKTPLSFTLFVMIYFTFFGAWDTLYPALIDSVYAEFAVNLIARFNEFRSIAYTMIVAFSGSIMGLWGYKTTFLIASVVLFISGIIILKSKSKTASDNIRKTNTVALIKEDSGIRKLVSIFMIAGTGMLMMLPAIPILEVNLLNLSDAKIGILLAVNSLAYILCMEVWSYYVKNITRLYTTFSVGIVAIIGMALIYAFLPDYFMLILANIFCGIGESSLSFFWQTFSISYPDYRTEDLSSLHLFTCGIRGIYAPLFGALIISVFDVKMNFLLSIFLILISLFGFLFKGREIFSV